MANVYFTGKPCPKGHIADRYKTSAQCVVCAKIARDFKRADPVVRKQRSAAAKVWAAKNPEKVAQYKAKYVEKNREKLLAKQKEFYAKNLQRRKNIIRKHVQKHKAKYAAIARNRQSLKLKAMPAWVNVHDITIVYSQAEYISYLTQIKHEVDHIIPLQNEFVCGLHVPWNLQILDQKTNRQKSNYFEGSK